MLYITLVSNSNGIQNVDAHADHRLGVLALALLLRACTHIPRQGLLDDEALLCLARQGPAVEPALDVESM